MMNVCIVAHFRDGVKFIQQEMKIISQLVS